MSDHNWLLPNAMTPNIPVTFDEAKCIGCNTCVNICRTDVLLPNPEKGKPPIVLYPDECWFCATCAEDCPTNAIEFHHPLNQIVPWKRKATGEMFREGLDELPQPNPREPID